jgi:hypothetical protein
MTFFILLVQLDGRDEMHGPFCSEEQAMHYFRTVVKNFDPKYDEYTIKTINTIKPARMMVSHH